MDNKVFTTALVCALFASSMVIALAYAQTSPSIPQPSVPEFTLKYVDGSIDVTIMNQSFTPFNDVNSKLNYLFYNVRAKGPNDINWRYYNQTYNVVNDEGIFSYIGASSSNSAVLVFNLGVNEYGLTIDASPGSIVDFEVQAYFGYWTAVPVNPNLPFVNHSATSSTVLTVTQTSDWSKTQTIAVPGPSSSISPSPASTPSSPSSKPPTQQPTLLSSQAPNNTQENFAPIAIIAGLAIGIVVVALLAYGAKCKGWK